MGLTPARRAVAVVLGAHGFIALIVLALQALPRTLTPVSRACGDSPTPGLCALLHGQARAAARVGPNEGGRPREGDNAGGGSATATSAGGGGRHLEPGPAPVLSWPGWLIRDLPELPPDPCRGPCWVRGPWLAPERAHPPKEDTRPQAPPPPGDDKGAAKVGKDDWRVDRRPQEPPPLPALPPCPDAERPPAGLLPGDEVDNLELEARACGCRGPMQSVIAAGCFNAALDLERLSPARARGYHARACALGEAEGCTRAEQLRRGEVPPRAAYKAPPPPSSAPSASKPDGPRLIERPQPSTYWPTKKTGSGVSGPNVGATPRGCAWWPQ